MVDRVTPIKYERPDTGGGDEFDDAPSDLDPNEDAIEVRGAFFQNDTARDEIVFISRDALDNMTFQDGVVAGVKTLSDLLAGGSSTNLDGILTSRNTGQTLVSRNTGDVLVTA